MTIYINTKKTICESDEMEEEAKHTLRYMEYKERKKEERIAKNWSNFIQVWWLKQPSSKHWGCDFFYEKERNEVLYELFYGRPLWIVCMEENAKTVYRNKSNIPDHLVSKSHFKRKMNPRCGKCFESDLKTSECAYIGNKTAWWLYDISEYERIKKLYPLRLDYPKLKTGECLVHKTEAFENGIDLTGLKPVFETQTSYGDWYYLYKVKP